jgi:hypothetical protein
MGAVGQGGDGGGDGQSGRHTQGGGGVSVSGPALALPAGATVPLTPQQAREVTMAQVEYERAKAELAVALWTRIENALKSPPCD